VIIDYEGRSYLFEFDDIGVKQGIAIEKHTGLPFAEWGAAIAKGGNMLALQALGWVILNGGDLTIPIGDVDFKMGKFGAALDKALSAEADAAKAAEETGPRPTAGASPAPPEANGHAATGLLSAASSDPT